MPLSQQKDHVTAFTENVTGDPAPDIRPAWGRHFKTFMPVTRQWNIIVILKATKKRQLRCLKDHSSAMERKEQQLHAKVKISKYNQHGEPIHYISWYIHAFVLLNLQDWIIIFFKGVVDPIAKHPHKPCSEPALYNTMLNYRLAHSRGNISSRRGNFLVQSYSTVIYWEGGKHMYSFTEAVRGQ